MLTFKKFIESFEEWIGVDLDGTLARYNGWEGIDHIGEPLLPMVTKIKEWIAAGKTVKIFTARASDPKSIPYIKKWLKDNDMGDLEITNIKDHGMIELWDDRAVRVLQNTGVRSDQEI